MDPVLIIFVQNVAAAAFAIVSRKLAPRVPHAYYQATAVAIGVEVLIGLAWAGIRGGAHLADLARWWPFLVAGGIAFALTNAVSFMVFRYVDAAIASLLATFNIVAAILASTLVIREGLSLRTGLGGLLIISASWIVLSAHVGKQMRRNWTLGLGLSLLAALFFGFATVNEKFLLNHIGMSSYVVWGWGLQFAAVLICSLIFSRGYREIAEVKPYALLGLAGGIRAVSGLFFILALVTINNLSVVSALSGLKVVLAALFGLLFLQEGQFMTRKFGASVMAALGVAVMFW